MGMAEDNVVRGGEVGNLFAGLARISQTNEIVETIFGVGAPSGVRIERIVSTGQASEPGFWYDQPQGEWVLLVQGYARLRFEDQLQSQVLWPGDYVYIAAHRRHCVEFTQARPPTIWLAIHLANEAGS